MFGICMQPNGRFETNKKICLSISGHHPESWQPSWSLRTAMLAIIGKVFKIVVAPRKKKTLQSWNWTFKYVPRGTTHSYTNIFSSIPNHYSSDSSDSLECWFAFLGFMPTEGQGAIGSLECSSEERKKLARRSVNFTCPQCGNLRQLLKVFIVEMFCMNQFQCGNCWLASVSFRVLQEPSSSGPSAANKEAKELAAQMSFTSENVSSKEKALQEKTSSAVPSTTETQTQSCTSFLLYSFHSVFRSSLV